MYSVGINEDVAIKDTARELEWVIMQKNHLIKYVNFRQWNCVLTL